MAMTVAACSRLRESSGLRLVVLSGGCFQNALLAAGTADALARAGFDVRRPREIPPGDGGLAFGQLAVAAAQGSRA